MAYRKLAACAAYLVGRGADAEDEPRGEVGPGDRLRVRQEEDDEEESSAAERLPHGAQPSQVQARAAGRPRVPLFGRPRGADGFYTRRRPGPRAGRPPRWQIVQFPCGRRR